ncbi:hypothetical protein HPP92_013070 [Vanilla planifolia]|uniref:BHLH domain-containing protein n=1 Tax=Vanilla planifolia TaxID=51239 RepID=A0A835UUG7_VANPL|nr:hypothetical protein HPP92_013070 [Vanilla planifolia]
MTEDEINDLVYKLQSLLPEAQRRSSAGRASASKLLRETCSHIRRLRRELDGLSEQLAGLIATMDADSAEAEIVRSLLRS